MWRQTAALGELGKGVGKDGWRQQERLVSKDDDADKFL